MNHIDSNDSTKTEFIGMKFDGVLQHLGVHETYDDAYEDADEPYVWIWSRDGFEHLLSMGKEILKQDE
jgi:hypothetical protein